MPAKGEVPLERPASSSPPLSPASSLSSEHSHEVAAAAHVKKSLQINAKKRHEVVKPTFQLVSLQRLFSSAGSDTSMSARCSNRSGDKQDPSEAPIPQKENAEDSGAWSVLVAVRCRPRKRQRAEKRFNSAPRVDDRLRHPRFQASHYSSSGSSGSDESGGSPRPSAGSVQRGVFEYSACRGYDFAATYDGKVPPPRVQRPRRLFVQAPTHGTGGSSGRRSFDFDFIFPPWKKQRDVYDKCVEAQIRHVLLSHQQGLARHATIVAYGQTGTGKTYTMGMLSDFTNDAQRGIIPRALSQILGFAGSLRDETDALETVVTLSFLQIYLETIQDLLALPGSASHDTSRTSYDARRGTGDLPVRQGRDGAFYVTGLNEYEITTVEDAHALLELATRNRVLAATAKNKTSSRSHTLLTISVKRRRQGPARRKDSSSDDEDEEYQEDTSVDEEDEFRQASTISFVDLAGSERVDGALHFLRATRARQEQRIREAKFINRSLSALGGVIAALAQPKPSTSMPTPARVLARLNSGNALDKTQHPAGTEPHIRFRDSQLTKLLQGRLMGGRGRLLLIATVDDQPKNLSETLSTLKFAAQCRRVELHPGSRLRTDRNTRLRRQDSLLDQVLNDMKTMHENREAALQSEYQGRIEVLERELEAARAAALLTSSQDVAPLHLASYTALCSLVDTVCSVGGDRERKHPSFVEFQGEKDTLEYVAMLYTRLKEALASQQHETPTPKLELNAQPDVRNDGCSGDQLRQPTPAVVKHIPNEPAQAASQPASESRTRRTRGRIQLSPQQEAEFKAVARHLITTQALDSIVVSSSEDEEE